MPVELPTNEKSTRNLLDTEYMRRFMYVYKFLNKNFSNSPLIKHIDTICNICADIREFNIKKLDENILLVKSSDGLQIEISSKRIIDGENNRKGNNHVSDYEESL